VNGFELFRLGRALAKIGEDAMPGVSLQRLPAATRLVMFDAFEHPGSSISEITDRTGLPQSAVSTAVAKLREEGALVTNPDPDDGRRTLVHMARDLSRRAAAMALPPVDATLAAALGTGDPAVTAEVISALETVGRRLLNGRSRTPQSFDAAYAGGVPPWDIGRPQPAFAALAEAGAFRGAVLDTGCGTGEHVLLAASLGLMATGVDSAGRAIAAAREKARERGLSEQARFVQGDALDLEALGGTFDTVVDSGFFHVLSDEDRARFVQSLTAVTRPGGRYFMACFSDRVPGTLGPRRIREQEIRDAFATGWVVDAVEASRFETTMNPEVPAWLAAITRT
jgi:SAM-dependent methyltransferase